MSRLTSHTFRITALAFPLVVLLGSTQVFAQARDYHWHPLAGIDPPYLAAQTYDLAEFPNSCGQFELISTGPVSDNGFASNPGPGPMAWDGACWRTLGGGVSGDGIQSMLVFDDGHGPALYVCGRFRFAGGVEVNNIARWDGSQWISLGGGMPGDQLPFGVYALEVYDDGRGPALYAGGYFFSAGGVPANHIARWNGKQWEPLDDGLFLAQASPIVWDVEVFDDGSGPALFVSGSFFDASGTGARWIAKWNGREWSNLGFNASGTVSAMRVYNDGSGAALYLTLFGLSSVGKWDGKAFTLLPGQFSTMPQMHRMEVFDDGSGNGRELYLAGHFVLTHEGQSAQGLAKWNGKRWSAVGAGLGAATSDGTALLVSEDRLVVAQAEYGANTVPQILAWNSNGWASLQPNGACAQLPAVHDPDANSDGCINVDDLIVIVLSWGPCPGSACPGDVNQSGAIDVDDLILLILSWG